jgi:manganese/iron transport system substrate-binding protein
MKFFKTALFLVAATFCLLASTGEATAEEPQKKVVVCSTTQIADFARNVVGDLWEVKCVLGPGEDPHNYRTTTKDSAAVTGSDLCLENGWNLEGHGWMRTLAENAGKPITTCIEGVNPVSTDEEGVSVKDPHAWMDANNAWIYVKNIRDAVTEIDPDNASFYEARADLYRLQLKSLNLWIGKQVGQIPAERRILVSHHDAFEYFCRAYNFTAISPKGWTTEELTGMNPQKIPEIVAQIREQGVKSVFIETTLNRELVAQIAREAGVEIGGELYSDAMGAQGTAGESYIGMMRENVLTIVGALKE